MRHVSEFFPNFSRPGSAFPSRLQASRSIQEHSRSFQRHREASRSTQLDSRPSSVELERVLEVLAAPASAFGHSYGLHPKSLQISRGQLGLSKQAPSFQKHVEAIEKHPSSPWLPAGVAAGLTQERLLASCRSCRRPPAAAAAALLQEQPLSAHWAAGLLQERPLAQLTSCKSDHWLRR